MTNQEKFVKFVKAYIKRDGVDELLEWLCATNFFVSPASAKYHLAKEGGLVEHSLNVFKRMYEFMQAEYGYGEYEIDLPYTKESIAIVSLLHDVGKIGLYKTTLRNVKDANGNWTQVESYATDENCLDYASHEEQSVYLIERFMKLTHEEALAIRYHAAGYGADDPYYKTRAMKAHSQSPLALFLSMADYVATCLDESTAVKPNPIAYGVMPNEDERESV